MKYRYIAILTLILSLCSCEERTPELFADMTGLYFNNTAFGLTVTDSLDYTFVYEASDLLEVPVKVQLLGRAAAQDRPFAITVTSDNAVEGVDYILPSEAVLPSGASSTEYLVTLKRTDALKKERKMIELQLHPNEYFALPVTDLVQVSGSVPLLNVRIYFSDMFTKAPASWDSNLVGEFTQQKFGLICKVLDIDPADFNDPSIITLAKLLYISAEMTSYVEGELQKKAAGQPYDEDILDKETGEPLTFR